MPQNLRLVRIFIGSPSDLREERLAFHRVLAEVNGNAAKHCGITLEAVAWEDAPEGMGRPQGIINEQLKKCDIVVLVLWKRWGTPTGAYTSGFEEEFEVARELKKEIWLYFRDIPADMMADPGTHLQQVISFRRRIEEEQSILYHQYSSTDEWAQRLGARLYKWILDGDSQAPDNFVSVDPPPDPSLAEILKLVTHHQAEIRELKLRLQDLNDRSLRMALELHTEAENASSTGRMTEAEQLYLKAVSISGNTSIAFSYAGFLWRTGQTQKSLAVLHEQFLKSSDTQDLLSQARALGNLSVIEHRLGRLADSEKHAIESVEILMRIGPTLDLAQALGNLGIVYFTLGKPEDAQAAYERALPLLQSAGDEVSLANLYNSLGILRQSQNDLKGSAELFNQALQVYESVKHDLGKANTLGNLGILYKDFGDAPRAEAAYLSAIQINERLGNLEGLANCWGNLGVLYMRHGRFAQAERCLLDALSLDKRIDHLEGVYEDHFNLGSLERLKGDHAKALEWYKLASSSAKALGLPAKILKAQQAIKEVE